MANNICFVSAAVQCSVSFAQGYTPIGILAKDAETNHVFAMKEYSRFLNTGPGAWHRSQDYERHCQRTWEYWQLLSELITGIPREAVSFYVSSHRYY